DPLCPRRRLLRSGGRPARYCRRLRAQDTGGLPLMTAETITQLSVHVGLGVLGLSFLLTVWRVIRGPTLPDRVIALDMLVGIVMGFSALFAARPDFTLYIDIAISLGLVGFLATVAFARFILSRRRREGEDGTLPAMSTDSPQPAVPAQKAKPARKRAPKEAL